MFLVIWELGLQYMSCIFAIREKYLLVIFLCPILYPSFYICYNFVLHNGYVHDIGDAMAGQYFMNMCCGNPHTFLISVSLSLCKLQLYADLFYIFGEGEL